MVGVRPTTCSGFPVLGKVSGIGHSCLPGHSSRPSFFGLRNRLSVASAETPFQFIRDRYLAHLQSLTKTSNQTQDPRPRKSKRHEQQISAQIAPTTRNR